MSDSASPVPPLAPLSPAAILLGVMRLPFLTLAPVCVLLGVAVVISQGQPPETPLSWLRVGWILLGAVLAHVAVNALNEYADFTSGLDLHTQRTPFSGGSGTLPAAPDGAHWALWLGAGALLACCLIGLWLTLTSGPGLLVIGAVGVLTVLSYTRYLNRYPWLCLPAPGIGFGLCIVLGTEYALTGGLSLRGWLAALVVYGLVSNLLLLNQFPDLEADRAHGRRHLVIVKGRVWAARLFRAQLLGVFALIPLGVWADIWSTWALLALLGLPLLVPLLRDLQRHADEPAHLLRAMGLNVVLNHLVPGALALGLWWAA